MAASINSGTAVAPRFVLPAFPAIEWAAIETWANTLTHFAPFLFVVGAGMVGLPTKSASASHAALIYRVALGTVFLASTLYHQPFTPALRKWFRLLDHAVIFVAIIGTIAAWMVVANDWKWGPVLVLTKVAVMIIGYKAMNLENDEAYYRFDWLGYLVASWLCGLWALGLGPLGLLHGFVDVVKLWAGAAFGFQHTAQSSVEVLSLVRGGLAYSVGFVVYLNDNRIRLGHALFHLFVIAGAYLCYQMIG